MADEATKRPKTYPHSTPERTARLAVWRARTVEGHRSVRNDAATASSADMPGMAAVAFG